MSDLENLPNHCSSNNCKWCADRRARRHAQSLTSSKANLPEADHWDRTLRGDVELLGYWPVYGEPKPLAFNGTGIRYLRKRNFNHRKITKRRDYVFVKETML